jgi:hypothetical protein
MIFEFRVLLLQFHRDYKRKNSENARRLAKGESSEKRHSKLNLGIQFDISYIQDNISHYQNPRTSNCDIKRAPSLDHPRRN